VAYVDVGFSFSSNRPAARSPAPTSKLRPFSFRMTLWIILFLWIRRFFLSPGVSPFIQTSLTGHEPACTPRTLTFSLPRRFSVAITFFHRAPSHWPRTYVRSVDEFFPARASRDIRALFFFTGPLSPYPSWLSRIFPVWSVLSSPFRSPPLCGEELTFEMRSLFSPDR